MFMKYIRFENDQFIIWPDTDEIWHKHMAIMGRPYGNPISAGFVRMGKDGLVCYGVSESLNLASHPDDSALIREAFI